MHLCIREESELGKEVVFKLYVQALTRARDPASNRVSVTTSYTPEGLPKPPTQQYSNIQALQLDCTYIMTTMSN